MIRWSYGMLHEDDNSWSGYVPHVNHFGDPDTRRAWAIAVNGPDGEFLTYRVDGVRLTLHRRPGGCMTLADAKAWCDEQHAEGGAK